MGRFLGIDTSNYKTSLAVYDTETDSIVQYKRPLAVKDGAMGLRQSDAVFLHVKNLGEMLPLCESELTGLEAVCVSTTPRSVEGSYMPCFLVGQTIAQAIGASLHVPVYQTSHQLGHIAAALYNTGNLSLICKEFLAFHFSGGTTECVKVGLDEHRRLSTTLLLHSTDLKAGQAIDRVGGKMGLAFPAGPQLEKLALLSARSYKITPSFCEDNPSLSGLQNQCEAMLQKGESHEDVALYCIRYIEEVVLRMTQTLQKRFAGLPIVYSGGVMSNSIIQQGLKSRFKNVYFATPDFSADNAAGVSVLGAMQQTGVIKKDECTCN